MVEKNPRQILFVEDKDIVPCTISSEVKLFSEEEELISYAIKKYKDFESFDIFMHGQFINRLIQSGVLYYGQLRRMTFYCDSINDMEQAKKSFNIIPAKVHFCLKSEVVDRIQNVASYNALKSNSPLNPKIIKSNAKQLKCRVQRKQESLGTESTRAIAKHMVGFDAKCLEAIDGKYLCGLCGYILRDPVQLNCGHRFCKSCAENQKQDIVLCSECDESTSKEEILLDKGFMIDMQILNISCSICAWNGQLKEYKNHLDRSHANLICKYCARIFESAKHLSIHQRTNCHVLVESCPLKPYGCSHTESRFQIEHHYLTEEHQFALIKTIKHLSENLLNSQSAAKDETGANQLQGNEITNAFANTISTLNEAVQRFNTELLPLQNSLEASTQALLSRESMIQEEMTLLYRMKFNQIQEDLTLLEQKLDDLSFISTDGTLTWKITYFWEKIENIRSGNQVAIYSPPFYSSISGYKMRAYATLCDDGGGMHMSLSLALLPEKYDNLLSWPFNYRIIFCLYNQILQTDHIINTFRPDITSNSFQRPGRVMDAACDIPKFCSLATIEQENSPYVQDDTVFIKVIVDFGHLPDDSLTFALSLNPGIPNRRQNEMIQAEANKFNQL